MQIQVNQLVTSVLKTGTLIAAIDRRATNTRLAVDELCPTWELQLPATVIRVLWNGSSNKTLHMGVLGLACCLNKTGYPIERELRGYLVAKGISISYLDTCMQYARKRGIARMLRSFPKLDLYRSKHPL